MAGLYGADVAQLRALAGQFAQAADQLDQGRLQVGNGIRISAWVGPFAGSFRVRWDSEHSLRIAAAARRLRDGAQQLRANADEQERASAADGRGTRPSLPTGFINLMKGWQSVKNARDSALDWVKDRGADLWNAGTSFVDKAGKGLKKAWDWAADRGAAIGDDWMNVLDSGAQFWNATGGSLLRGRWPRTTEVAASALRLAGATSGALITQGTLGIVEANFFDDGVPYAGDPQPPANGYRAPTSLADVARTITSTSDSGDGLVRVTTIDTPEGPRVIVSIPGTKLWYPSAGGNPMDFTGNLVTAGGGRSTMTSAVELALAKANIPPNAQVMLVGHSQGGMTAADLASDPAFVSRYHVTNVMTVGSPIDSDRFDPRVNVLNVQHATDVVPQLDLGDHRLTDTSPDGLLRSGIRNVAPRSGPNQTVVTLPSPSGPLDIGGNHGLDGYSSSISASQSTGLTAYEQSLRDSGFLSGNAGNTSAVEFQVGRKD